MQKGNLLNRGEGGARYPLSGIVSPCRHGFPVSLANRSPLRLLNQPSDECVRLRLAP